MIRFPGQNLLYFFGKIYTNIGLTSAKILRIDAVTAKKSFVGLGPRTDWTKFNSLM
jgi:hypothetical protein